MNSIAGRDPSFLLEGLDARQREAAEALEGPVAIFAGAGTGKTRAITHRIAYGAASGAFNPEQVLALTFTNKAAAELRGRLRKLGIEGVNARTFHAAALAQLRYFWPQAVGGEPPRLLDSKGRLLSQVAARLGLKVDAALLRDLAAEVEWRKVTGLSIEGYLGSTRTPPAGLSLQQVAEVQRGYENSKDMARVIDFEDVLLACAGMLETEPRIAAKVREQYRHFTVDEFQDVSALQVRLLQLWLGPSEEVCVVGDVSQTIYSFAGADSGYLLKFPETYPSARIVRLETDYRSVPPIVELANSLMRKQPGALELVSSESTGSVLTSSVSAGSVSASSKTYAGPELRSFESEQAEARAVAGRISELIKLGARPGEIAVLFRMNAHSAEFERALAEAGISYRVLGGPSYFELPEVRQAIMMLRASAIGKSKEPLFKTVSDILRTLGWSQNPPEVGGAGRNRWEALNTIIRLTEELPAGAGLNTLVRELEELASIQHEPNQESVNLATLHSSKGLEWDAVFITGLREGVLPISYAKTPMAIEEERRLLYVGITRARKFLSLSWSARSDQRSSGGSPSRFLAELKKAN